MSEVTVCLPCFFPSRSAVFVGAGADDDDAATLEAGCWDFFLFFFFTGGQGTWVIKRASIFHGKKKRKEKKKKSLTSPVKAEDHGGNSASFGAICCVGGPRCAAPHGNVGLEGEGAQTNPMGANAPARLACFSGYHGQNEYWGPSEGRTTIGGGSAPTTTNPSRMAEEETLGIPGQAVGCLSQSHRETVHHPHVRANQSADRT